MGKRWYVIHTLTGEEERVKKKLLRQSKFKKLDDKISQVLIPTEIVSEVKGGKKKISSIRSNQPVPSADAVISLPCLPRR